jgi:membrane protein
MLAAQVARVRAELNTHPAGRALDRILLGITKIELVDRSMTLAAQLFTSVLPVIMAASVLVDSAALRETLLDPFGVDPNAFVQDGFEVTSEAAAFGAVGLLMVLISGTSFARALGRIYGKIWAAPALRLSHAWRWCAVLLLVATSALVTGLIHQLGSPLLAVVAQWCMWVCVWTACPSLLTSGQVPARVLIGTGVLTATLLTAVNIGGRVVLPHVTASSEAHFGVLGIIFTIVGYLFVLAIALVASPVIVEAVIGRADSGEADQHT